MDEYPNSSEAIEATQQWNPEPPKDRVETESKELAKVSSSIGVIQDVIDWFNANAEHYASVDSLGIDESTPEPDAKLAILLSKRMRAIFQSKSSQFRSEFAKYLKEEEAQPQA